MRKLEKRDKKIIAVGLIGVIVLIGIFFVVRPGGLPCPYSQPPSRPYIYNITPDPDPDGNVYIHWDPCLRVERYRVFIYNPSGNLDSGTYVGIATSYTKNGLSNGVWGFEVVAENCAGTSGHSSRESVTVSMPSVPSAPWLNTITPNPDTDGTIDLTWGTSAGATSYRVYRSKESGLYAHIATISRTSYTDSGIGKAGQSIIYNYKIRAFNQYGGSVKSNKRSVTVSLPALPPPPSPPDPPFLNTIIPDMLTYDKDGDIGINWMASAGADSYKIYRCKDRGTYGLLQSGWISLGYNDLGLSNGKYTYKLKATSNAYGDSDYSNTQSVDIAIPEPPNIKPTATIISITPNPAKRGDTISFRGSGIDSDGTIEEYQWVLADLTVLSSSATFTKSANDFNVGTHTIGFRVKDNDGEWATIDTKDLTVNEIEIVNKKPIAIIISITPNPATQEIDTISFSGSGTDTDGTITDYEWSSSIDGTLSVFSTFSKPAGELSIGQHTIYFRVRDNNGKWSDKVSEILTIEGEEVVVLKPDAPILYDITPSTDTDGIILLSWSIDENADSYKVYRDGLCIRSGLTVNSYTDRDLDDGTYTYTITAVNEKGESDYSNEEVVIVDTSGVPPPPELDDMTGMIVLLVVVIVAGISVIYFTRRLKKKLVR